MLIEGDQIGERSANVDADPQAHSFIPFRGEPSWHGTTGPRRRVISLCQYYDTASASNPASFGALLNIVPSSQVLFGSDFPFLSARETAGDLMYSGLPESTVEEINRANALRLFECLKG